MKSRTLLLSAAAIILLAAAALAQKDRTPLTSDWVGKSVVLTRVDGRAMAPACPTFEQIRPYSKSGRWDPAALGCRFLLAGNFTRAEVLQQNGDFLRLRFTLTAGAPPRFLPQENTFWTPRDHYRLAP